MSLTVANVTTDTENASTSGRTVTGVTAAIGDVLVMGASFDNAGAAGIASLSTTVTDSAGNTWVNQSLTNRTAAGVANDGTTLGIWTCLVTATLTAGTVTLSCSPNTTAKAVGIAKTTPGAAGDQVLIYAVGPGVTAGGASQSAGTVSVPIGYTIFGFSALEANAAPTADADTTNGSWSTALTASIGASGTTGQTISIQWKTVTATGNQTYNTSTGSGADSAANYLILASVPGTGVGSAAGTATAAGVGASIATAAGASAGSAAVSGTGASIATAVASAAAIATALAVGAAIGRGAGSSFSTSVATAEPYQVVVTAVGSAAGRSLALGRMDTSQLGSIALSDELTVSLREAYAVAPADDLILHTIEIRHPAFVDEDGNPDSIWLVLNTEDITATVEASAPVRGGEDVDFVGFAFTFALAPIEPNTTPEITLTVDNVDRRIVENLDLAMVDGNSINLVYRPYLQSDLSEPQMDPLPEFELSDVKVDPSKVTATAASSIDLRGAYPLRLYTTDKFAGLIGQ